MTVLKGLAGLQKFQQDKVDEAARREAAKAEGAVNWMVLKDTHWIQGRFLNEIDETSPNYLAANGTAHIVLEHTGPGPQGFKRRAECTAHEGNCYVDEKRAEANKNQTEDWKNWSKAKPRIYLNFLVTAAGGNKVKDPKTGKEFEPKHAAGDIIVVGQSVDSDQSIVGTLLEYAADGSITDREFRISCKGWGTDTTYRLKADDRSKSDVALDSLELNDLSAAYKQVPYEAQPQYYDTTPGWTGGAASAEPSVAATGSDGEKKGAFTSW